ncbi:MAG: hypothetical protein GY751_18685, partial [Bacteroidetes bacterium]|nr:hypothetical protein [Bacteroidota bacterium]
YVADGRELHIIDLRSPQAFPLLASYDIDSLAPGSATIKDIIARGKYVYLITYRGLVVLDVSDVSNPQVTDIYGISKHRTSLDLKVYRDHLYAIFPDEGVLIFDLVDPASPNYVARMQVATGRAQEIDFSGDYAYIVLSRGGENFLEIWDIHNPYTPERVLEYGDEEKKPNNVVIQGDYAYLDRGYTRIGVLDISDPLAPKALGSVRTKGVIEEYIVDGDYVYIA